MMPSSLVFFTLAIVGGVVVVGASSWVTVYLGFIINAVGVIPLLAGGGSKGWKAGEAAGKYFLVQAIGTLVFGFGGLLSSCLVVPGKAGDWGGAMMVLGLLIKLGMFPFHVWVPGVLMGLSWRGCWVVLTWQKVIAYIAIAQVLGQYGSSGYIGALLGWSVVGSCFVGAVGGLGQTNMRSLLAYSSILHGGWALMSAMCGGVTLGVYMATYVVAVSVVICLFESACVRGVQGLALKQGSGIGGVMPLILGMLTLQGMPPFVGFLGKWVVLSSWASMGFCVVPAVAALGGTALGLYYYLVVVFGLFWRATTAGALRASKGGSGLGVLLGWGLVSALLMVVLVGALG